MSRIIYKFFAEEFGGQFNQKSSGLFGSLTVRTGTKWV
jgi:hypothetical protein